MTRVFLQAILEDISSSNLPYNWNSLDLKDFSRNKNPPGFSAGDRSSLGGKGFVRI